MLEGKVLAGKLPTSRLQIPFSARVYASLSRFLTLFQSLTEVTNKNKIEGRRDGVGRGAEFDGPAGLSLGSLGELFICDSNNGLLRKGVTTDRYCVRET